MLQVLVIYPFKSECLSFSGFFWFSNIE